MNHSSLVANQQYTHSYINDDSIVKRILLLLKKLSPVTMQWDIAQELNTEFL